MLPIRLKETNNPNLIRFVTGGGILVWVGSVIALLGIMLTIYVYLTQVAAEDSVIDVAKTLLFPLTAVLFGVLMAVLRYEFTIDGTRHCVTQANTFGPFRLSAKQTDREAFRAVELERIVLDPSSPDWDWFSVQLRPADQQLPIGLISRPASEEVEVFAQRVANMLELPLEKIETTPHNAS